VAVAEVLGEAVGFGERTALDGDAATGGGADDAHPANRPTTTRPAAARPGIRTMISGTRARENRFIASDQRLPLVRSDGRQGEISPVAHG
jgi:hypothetical protein